MQFWYGVVDAIEKNTSSAGTQTTAAVANTILC